MKSLSLLSLRDGYQSKRRLAPDNASVSRSRLAMGGALRFLAYVFAAVALVMLTWSVNTFLIFTPQADFPYLSIISVFGLSLLYIIGFIRQTWYVQRSACTRRSITRASFTASTIIVCFLVSTYLWAFLLVGHDHRIRSIRASHTTTSISQAALQATVAMEDRNFYNHYGMDLKAMHRALRVNVREGRVEQGGSTITQQLVKNLFLDSHRSFLRKALEIPLTIEVERQLTKAQILDLYMHVIPYGSKQLGIDNAAQFYFHETPNKLTLAQSVLLVSIVPHNPSEIPNEHVLTRWRKLSLPHMVRHFPDEMSSDDVEAARSTPVGQLIYPYRTAYDRGATESIPAGWHGVLWFSYLSKDAPQVIPSVAPLLKSRLGAFASEALQRYGVVAIDHLGAYADRAQREDTSRISAHAFGQALDIAGFRFADGTQIAVRDHNQPSTAARLAPLSALLRKHFDLVVDWTNEPKLHQDHIHAEVIGPRPMLKYVPLPIPISKTISTTEVPIPENYEAGE